MCDAEAPIPFMPPGSYFYTLDWHEAQDGQFLLQLPNVQPSSSGIYSATYLEASPLGSAFFRLIVRGQEQRAEVVGAGPRASCAWAPWTALTCWDVST